LSAEERNKAMLRGNLIHPEILEALGTAGHGSRVLIADGNYPASTALGPNAVLVSLNLSPGVVSCTQVLESLLSVMPVESAAVMEYYREGPYALSEDPPVWTEYRKFLGNFQQPAELEEIERFAFYDKVKEEDVCLTIQTADQRVYANLLLTFGVIMPS
jgi:L-fucose mutarotase